MTTEHAEARYELTLSFDKLTLIYKSLLAAKSFEVLSQTEEFVDDPIQLVDQTLDGAALGSARRESPWQQPAGGGQL